MENRGTKRVVKYALVSFFCSYGIFGCIMIGAGCFMSTKSQIYLSFAHISVKTTLLYGLFTLGFAIYGCLSGSEDSRKRLIVLSLAAVAMFLAIATDAFSVDHGQVIIVATESFQSHIHIYKRSKAWRRRINNIQWDLKCCGLNSSNDWRPFTPFYYKKEPGPFPVSCCPKPRRACDKPAGTPCRDAMITITGNSRAMAIAMLTMQLMASVVSFMATWFQDDDLLCQ